jgi:integrase
MSLTKRKGVFYADFIDGSGRRIRKSLKTPDKKLARELYDQLKADSWRQRHFGETPRRSWKESVVRYLNETAHKRSHETDISRLRWLDRFMGNTHLDQIGPDLIEKIIDDRVAKGLKPASINQILGLVHNICRRAHREWQWLDKEVHVRMLKFNNERDRVLSDDEEPRLLAALPSHLSNIARFALATGLRKTNILGLRWDWVDLDRKVLTIPASSMKASRHHGIPITEAAMSVLRRNRGKHPDYVFTYKGKRIASISHTTWMKSCRKARVDNLHFHDLRRTFGTRLAIAGVPLDAIMRLGGWSSYAILLRRYAHLQPEHLREHAEAASRKYVTPLKIVP